jgi:hypothetical protein
VSLFVGVFGLCLPQCGDEFFLGAGGLGVDCNGHEDEHEGCEKVPREEFVHLFHALPPEKLKNRRWRQGFGPAI